jgi:hypothetical protein
MRANLHRSLIALLMISSAAVAQGFAPQRRRDAVRSAKTYLAGLESPGRCPANIDADPELAVGVVVNAQISPFSLFVPQKDVEKTDFQGKEVESGYGVPVGYLIPTGIDYLIVNGHLVEWPKMRHTVVEDAQAGKLIFNCLVLTASRAKDGSYLLHVFGTGVEPLVSVPLENIGKTKTSVEVKDLDLKAVRLKLVLTLGAGWRASIPLGTRPMP